jgi:two-component system chemotaxis response regulator CheY
MSAADPQLDRHQERQRARFERMGLSAHPMPGGRSLLISIPMSSAPFESVSGPLSIERIIFATVGPDQIKCLRPRAVFGLPLLTVSRCADRDAVESAIRQAWRQRTNELRETGRTLKSLGIEVGAVEGASVLAFPVQGEAPSTRVLMQSIDEAILPSSGPLSGIALSNMHDRILDVTSALESGSDLDCLIGNQIEALQKSAKAAASEQRTRAQDSGPPAPVLVRAEQRRSIRRPKILLVGNQVIQNAELREALSQQGYQLATARSETEALVRLAGMSPDLILSQYALGRSDGATFVQGSRALPGIDRIPVVLLDETKQESRREAARIVGAAGYLIHPKDTTTFVARLNKLLEAPGDRRFTRYPQRLSARLEGWATPCVATEVGRGGVFITTDEEIEENTSMRCEIALPEIGRTLTFDGEVLYASMQQGSTRKGIGLRFSEISSEDETALIKYLGLIESSR